MPAPDDDVTVAMEDVVVLTTREDDEGDDGNGVDVTKTDDVKA